MEQDSFATWYEAWGRYKINDLEASLASYKKAVEGYKEKIKRCQTDPIYARNYNPITITKDIDYYETKIEELENKLVLLKYKDDMSTKDAYKALHKMKSITSIVVHNSKLFISTIPIIADGKNIGRYQIAISASNILAIENLDWEAKDTYRREETCFHPHIWKCSTACLREYYKEIDTYRDNRQLALVINTIIYFLGNFIPKQEYMSINNFVKERIKRVAATD